jgi:prepilin-type processing-associated H-X9-DG protein
MYPEPCFLPNGRRGSTIPGLAWKAAHGLPHPHQGPWLDKIASTLPEARFQHHTQAPLHSGLWNYAFVDGHVKALRPEQTIGAAGATGAHWGGGTYTCSLKLPCGMWTINPND